MLAVAALSGAMLAGCTPEAPVETTPPPTSPAPTVSEEEARAAWEAYQSRLSELGADPAEASLDRLTDVATRQLAELQLENFEAAAERRIHTEGGRTTSAFEVTTDGAANVCVDVSAERVVGDEGIEIEPSEPRSSLSITAQFERHGDGWLVARDAVYDGSAEGDPCA